MNRGSPKTHRFVLLDGLRGIAALAVLIFHIVQQHDVTALPFAALAVDFFYMLSGFVVAFAYEKRLHSRTMGFNSFAWARITRLYPLVLLGTLSGIALALLAATIKGNITYQDIAIAGSLALLLLPSYVFPQWNTAYPFNMASWSLTFELVVNALYGAIAPKLTLSRLIKLTALSVVLLIWVAFMNHEIAGGNNQDNFAYGFGRVMFPFFAGVLLYRLRLPQRMAPRVGLGIILGLAGLLLIPVHEAGHFSLLYVLLLFPLIIATGAAVEVGPGLSRACRVGGELSYPVYILQGPILRGGEELLKYWHGSLIGSCLFGITEAGIVIAFAHLALKFYDEPLQVYFKARKQRVYSLPKAYELPETPTDPGAA